MPAAQTNLTIASAAITSVAVARPSVRGATPPSGPAAAAPINPTQRPVDQAADGELSGGAAQHRRECRQPDQQQQPWIAAQPLLDQLGQRQGKGVEHQPAHHRDKHQHDDRPAHQVSGSPGMLPRRAWPQPRAPAVHHKPSAAQTTPGTMNAARQPAWLARNAVTTGATPHPYIAEHAVDADGAARPVSGVDDAIVVLENVMRHIEAGMPRVRAALQGAREVAFTVLAMTLAFLAVFVPMLLMGGIEGRLFRKFAVTLSVTITISFLVSLTLTIRSSCSAARR